jgi:hypothetical protein
MTSSCAWADEVVLIEINRTQKKIAPSKDKCHKKMRALRIFAMQYLRNTTNIIRFVLVWFALSVGVAIASPIVQPKAMDMVCTSTGSMKLVVQGDGDSSTFESPTLDCPLCATICAPPPALNTALTQPSPLSHALLPLVAAHIASLTAPPLPSRGPPTFPT